MHPWLRRLRHDLLKPALWAARDLQEAGGRLTPADRAALRHGLTDLCDHDGAPVTAPALFAKLRADAPAGLPAPALDAFGRAVAAAVAAVDRGAAPEALAAVLSLEPAFETLARLLEPRR